MIFNYVDPSHFYYVHLANQADEHANSIFIVDGKPRVSIAEKRTKGTKWDDGWHDVRIKRDPESGLIEVYFDDMTHPVMSAHDKTFSKGRIGLGTFDDTGMFDDFVGKAVRGVPLSLSDSRRGPAGPSRSLAARPNPESGRGRGPTPAPSSAIR